MVSASGERLAELQASQVEVARLRAAEQEAAARPISDEALHVELQPPLVEAAAAFGDEQGDERGEGSEARRRGRTG